MLLVVVMMIVVVVLVESGETAEDALPFCPQMRRGASASYTKDIRRTNQLPHAMRAYDIHNYETLMLL